MNKKKVQEFINKLKTSVETTVTEKGADNNAAEANIVTEENILQTTSEELGDVYTQNGYITVQGLNNGVPYEGTVVGGTNTVLVEIDLRGWAIENAAQVNTITTINMTVAGMNKMGHGELSVYKYDSNELIGRFWSGQNIFNFSFTPIIDANGKTRIHLVGEADTWTGQQSFPASFMSFSCPGVVQKIFKTIELISPPSKMNYFSGESFDSTGLVLGKVYTDGSKEIINSTSGVTITPSSGTTLQETHTQVVIAYSGKSIQLPLVVRERSQWSTFTYSTTVQVRTRKKITSETWSEWRTATGADGIYDDTIMAMGVGTGALQQFRTIMTLNSNSLNVILNTQKGMKIILQKYPAYGYNSTSNRGHIIVNGKRQFIYGMYSFAILDLGAIKDIIKNNYQIIFEHGDMDFVFATNGNAAPQRTFYRLLDEGYKSETKEFNLTAGAKARLDLVTGETSLVIPDIASDSTLLGLGVSHIFRYTSEDFGLGHRFRLNLHQRLRKVEGMSGLIECYEYEDAFGNKRSYYNYFYYLDDENEKHYFVLENPTEELVIENSNELWQTDENRRVYYSNRRLKSEVFDNYVDGSSAGIEYFRTICAQTENEQYIPQMYQKSNELVRGFNSDGNLVWVNDMYGNFISIQYNKYNRIQKVVDKDNNILQFSYDREHRLTAIKDNRGRKIEYNYSFTNNRLESIFHIKLNADGTDGECYKNYYISYENVSDNSLIPEYIVSDISSSDKENCVLEYADRLVAVTKYATIDKIPNGSSLGISEDAIISKYTVECSAQPYQTIITDIDGNREIFRFTKDKVLSEYYQEVNQKVSKAERYEYTPFVGRKVEKGKRQFLNKVAFEEYGFESGEIENTELNIYNNPVTTTINSVQVTPTSTKRVIIQYSYDELQRCIIERTTEQYSGGKSFVYVKRNVYDENTSALKQTIQYTEGEQATTGLTAEEYIYDAKGNITTTKQYKKLCSSNNPEASEYNFDSSSTTTIFYDEKTYNEQGLVGSEKDETGLNTTTYQYVSGTKLINKVVTPNGNSIDYAFDSDDNVVEMSSTIEGTENANTVGFQAGEMIEVNHSGNSDYVNYEYDKKHRISTIKFGENSYETISYADRVSYQGSVVDRAISTNANNEQFIVVLDRNGGFEHAYYKAANATQRQTVIEKTYNEYGQVVSLSDKISGENISIGYDSVGQIVNYNSVCDNENYSETFEYSYRGELTKAVYSGQVNRTNIFNYSSDSQARLISIVTGDFRCALTYDNYNRCIAEAIGNSSGTVIETKSISYRKEGSHATNMINELTYNNTTRLSYTYDSMGNIKSVKQNGLLISQYKYDGLNRLIREDNQAFGETYLYTYDNNGNVLSKETLPFTTVENLTAGTGSIISYFYNNKDQLQTYNGQACVYDAVGNPTSYKGKTLSWVRGRKLATYDNVSFEYDAQGKRISKNTIKYYYNSAGKLLASSDGMEYFYNTVGVMGFVYNGNKYIYRKNLQGDIIEILDSSGNSVVQYVYDAWGQHEVVATSGYETLAQLNPFRYRGYFYDVETGLYFLKTRYYDPEIGRFINIDDTQYLAPSAINGLNLYSYCVNNPVMNVDPNGTSLWSWVKKKASKAWSGIKKGTQAVWNNIADNVEKAWEDTKQWVSKNIGTFVESTKNMVEDSFDFLFGGFEQGINYISTLGDDSKVFSFYATNASEWWKFWEYQVGIKVRFGKFSYSTSFGLGESNASIGWNNKSFDVQIGIERIGVGTSYTSDNVGYYNQFYINTIPTALLVATFIYAPWAVPAFGFAVAK